ncbi:uncharacterized protein LOC120634668 isoform X3 [Pararge aegeria]|uniref:uncharacterized protein LOC120634668 isoform X3 n=1 Tax=Pararge aegeria TaxID=116150 RepID=UPI0019D30241|nr:uncharacterized protein LOC120634668 isoform X3 [Pararge aegeria]
MTSTNDGKDVKSIQTSGQKGKTYYIELYKSLDTRLSGECSGEDRTRLVCEAWRLVHSLCQHSTPSTQTHLILWLQQHTSHTLLQTEWQAPASKEQHTWLKDAINAFVAECRDGASKREGLNLFWETQLLNRAEWFLNVLPNPWGHQVLKALLDPNGKQPSDDEVLEWLKEERGLMFVTRLRQLASSRRCDDLALLLATAVMTRVRFTTKIVPDVVQAQEPKDKPEAFSNEPTFYNILSEEADFTRDVWDLLTDIEFVLHFKGETRARCIELAKQTELRHAYQLVGRLHNRLEKSPQDKKLWKNAKDVATLIAQVVIARCMVVPVCAGVVHDALYRCVYSLAQLLPADKLPAAAAALAAPAATSRHLHTLAAAVHAQCNEERKPFVCSLYVRAITAGMNELEKLKLEIEKQSEARAIEQILASWFIQLGTLLSASSRLSYECILTAFSVHPSPTMYEMVKRAPLLPPLMLDVQEKGLDTNTEYGSWATDSRTQTNLVKTSKTLKLKQTQKQANVLSTAIFAEGEGLGLEADLCQDLAVLLSGPRVKTLYWDLDREVLLENCRTYMARTHDGTRALTTELKYLNLDPNSFQHLPEEEDEEESNIYYGIEKGYEHLVEFEDAEPEDIMCDEILTDYSYTSDSASSIIELPMVIQKRKKKTNKDLHLSSQEEVDPLSLPTETLSINKDIPQSIESCKYKSKERSESKTRIEHTKEQDGNIGITSQVTKEIQKKAKKKERKERRKIEKQSVCDAKIEEQNFQSASNLSRLVGMKIARPNVNEQERQQIDSNINNTVSITDSDYDSQGKSSINSEYNDNVLTDSLYSIDNVNSSNRGLTDYKQRTNFPPFSYSPHTVSSVKEEVKKGIQKLIEYRRKKVFNESSTSWHSPVNRSPDFIIDRNLLISKNLSSNILSPVISSKLINDSSYISETRNNERNITSEKEIVNIAHLNIKDRPELSAKDRSVIKVQPKLFKPKDPSTVIKQAEDNLPATPSQKQYQDFLLQRKWNSIQSKGHSQSQSQKQFQEFLKKQYLRESELPGNVLYKPCKSEELQKPQTSQQTSTNVSPSQKQYHNFLKELQETINAGTNTMQDSKYLPKNAPKKCIQPKKVDNAANTYSRLSYMHKNKQSDIKLKLANNQVIHKTPSVNVTTHDMQYKGMHIKDMDLEKVSNLQSTGQIEKPKNKCKDGNSKVIVQKIENLSGCELSVNPMLSNILSSDIPKTECTLPKNEIKVIKQCNKPKNSTSFLSEKDQFDLLLLLRQQNKMNLPKMPVKTEIPKNNPSDILSNKSAAGCASSKKQCFTQNQRPRLKEGSKSKSCPISVIKTTNNKSSNNGCESKKNRVRCSKQKVKTQIESDWKSVMDDLLAHKTPSRGPNALDIVLNKDSFEKRLSDNLSNPINKKVVTKSPIHSVNNDNIAKEFTHSASTSRENLVNLKTTIKSSEDLKQKQEIIVQSINKINYVEMKKGPVPIQGKPFPNIIQNSDPFISGIPNSDYDLLEELMDDDLRQEIGELTSDEETYRTPHLSTSKTKNNFQTKVLNLPINKTNSPPLIQATGNPYSFSSILSSDSVKNTYNTNYSILNKELPSKNNSLPKGITPKKPAITNEANFKIISNEIISSSKFVKKTHFSGKVFNNVSGTTPEACHVKKKPVIKTSKRKNSHKKCTKICSNPKISKTVERTNVSKVNKVPERRNLLDPAHVVITVPKRNNAQNLMLVGTDLIYDPFSTIHLNRATKSGNLSDLNSNNTNVASNQTPVNVTLLHSTPFVAPVLSPVIIESAVSLPIVQNVSPNISMNLTTQNNEKSEINTVCKENQQTYGIKTELIKPNALKETKSHNDDLEASKFSKRSSPTEFDSDTFTSTPKALNKNVLSDPVKSNLLNSKKYDITPEVCESSKKSNIKQSIYQSVPIFNTKFNKKIQEDNKCAINYGASVDALLDKTLTLDHKNKLSIDKERLHRKRLYILNRLNNSYNRCLEKPIALPYASIISPRNVTDEKEIKLKATCNTENMRNTRTRRNISNKTDICQKESIPLATVSSGPHVPSLGTDLAVTVQEAKNVANAKETIKQNPVDNLLLSNENNVNKINLRSIQSAKHSENHTFAMNKSEHKKDKSQNVTNMLLDSTEEIVSKENIEEEKQNAKVINEGNDYVKGGENDTHLKSKEIQTDLMKQTFRKIDNICNENINKPASQSLINEDAKKVTNISNEIPQHVQLYNREETQTKMNDSNNESCMGKNIHNSEEMKVFNIDEQTKPDMIQCMKKKSDELCNNKIPLEDNITVIPQTIKETTKKLSEKCENKIPLINNNYTPRKQEVTSLISRGTNKATKELDEICVDGPPHKQNMPCPISQYDLHKTISAQQQPLGASNITKKVKDILSIEKSGTKESVTSTQLETVGLKKGKNDDCNRKSSLILQNEPCKTKNSQLLDAKITFDELPSDGSGPLKRCVRIKLPNGNTFKATISGKLNVDINSIFDDPTVKSLLWKNINNNSKCTLNIKQVSLQNEKEEIMKTEVKKISYPKPVIMTTDTINLISDDEEEINPQKFKTEFGNFNIASIDPSIQIKHQKKLSQKAVVVLKRCDVLQEFVPIDVVNITSIVPDIDAIQIENPLSIPQEIVTDYIEIDDSSNDSISVISSVSNTNEKTTTPLYSKKVCDLKNLLLQDLGVEVHNSKTQTENIMKNMKETNNSKDTQTEIQKITDAIDQKIGEVKIPVQHEQESSKSKKCLLKLIKCDDLVKQLQIKKRKCFVSLVRFDEGIRGFENKVDNKVIDKSLGEINYVENGTITETTLKRSDSFSILNEFDNSLVNLPIFNQDISQPIRPLVIENTNIPENNGYNIINSINILAKTSNKKCDAEWSITKSFLNKYENMIRHLPLISQNDFKEFENHEDNLTDCDSDLDVSFSTDESIQVPRLATLVFNFLVNDSDLLDRLMNTDVTQKNVTNFSPLTDYDSVLNTCLPTNKSYQVPRFSTLVFNFLVHDSDVMERLMNTDMRLRNVTNSSTLKRKSTENGEINRLNKISKTVYELSAEQVRHRIQNSQNIGIHNKIAEESLNHCSLKHKDVISVLDDEMKESNLKEDSQNEHGPIQSQEVISSLQTESVENRNEVSENKILENIAHTSQRLEQSSKNNLSADTHSENTSGINSTMVMEIEGSKGRNESILKTNKDLLAGENFSEETTCPIRVSVNAEYLRINEDTSRREGVMIKTNTCTTQNDAFIPIRTLDDNNVMQTSTRFGIHNRSTIKPCSTIIESDSLLQSKSKIKFNNLHVTMSPIDIVVQIKDKENCAKKDTKNSIQSNETEKINLDNDTFKIKNDLKTNHIDILNENDEAQSNTSPETTLTKYSHLNVACSSDLTPDFKTDNSINHMELTIRSKTSENIDHIKVSQAKTNIEEFRIDEATQLQSKIQGKIQTAHSKDKTFIDSDKEVNGSLNFIDKDVNESTTKALTLKQLDLIKQDIGKKISSSTCAFIKSVRQNDNSQLTESDKYTDDSLKIPENNIFNDTKITDTKTCSEIYAEIKNRDFAVATDTGMNKIHSGVSSANTVASDARKKDEPLLQQNFNCKNCSQINDESSLHSGIVCSLEEKERTLDVNKRKFLHSEDDRNSIEVQIENTPVSRGLNRLSSLQKALINSSTNQNRKIDQTDDLAEEIIRNKISLALGDSCSNKKECSDIKKENNVSEFRKKNYNEVTSNALEISTLCTNIKVKVCEDIGIKKTEIDSKISSLSNYCSTPKTTNIDESYQNKATKNAQGHNDNLDSFKEKRIASVLKSIDLIFQTNQGITENTECSNVKNNSSLKDLINEFNNNGTDGKVESNTPNNDTNTKFEKNVTLVYKGDSNVILKGSLYEDSAVGTCYVFPVLNKTVSNHEWNSSNICNDKQINKIEILKEDTANEDCDVLNVLDDVLSAGNFNVILPKLTYSRQMLKNKNIDTGDKRNRKNLKRKLSCYDSKLHGKRYRNGKNIDYPKISAATMLESAYSKEYKRLMEYCTSIKFSYSRPFHKEYINVPDIFKCWPIKELDESELDNTDFEKILFSEEQCYKSNPFDPLQYTLAEEISHCKEHQYISYDVSETNFSMGFGEGSDRVIQILEDRNNISNVSAATLSDVKQSQPFLMLEDYVCDQNQKLCMSHKHQIESIQRCNSFIKLRDKVRSYFKKTTEELNYNWLKDNMKSKYEHSNKNCNYLKSGFPYDLINSDFIIPAPVDPIVQVVQVGQLPVSAAAQNPITCDPRVTQVTDVSPQCSIENSPHGDSQSPIKTEYTELTTADLSMPVAHEYARYNIESQETSRMPNSHHEDIPVETEISSEVKTEITMELTPLKEEPLDYNDSDDLQSLVNKHINNVDYSFDSNDNSIQEPQSIRDVSYESFENQDFSPQEKRQRGLSEKTDQIAHAMNAAGITTTPEVVANTESHVIVDMMSQKNCQEGPAITTSSSTNNYSKTPLNTMTLHQALSQLLPSSLNQNNVHENNQTNSASSVSSQVLHIVKNTNGNQLSQNSVISNSNTPVLHIVNKGASTNSTSNANSGQHTNSYSGLSLVDTGQGSNQLLHIVNTGNQKNNSTGQLIKRVNLLTNLQGSNEQKMVQFVCKSADGKSIHLNAPHQRSMVLRLQPIESPNIQLNPKATESQDNTGTSATSNANNATSNKEFTNAQNEIKSRSVYEENYAKFIQNSSNKPVEKSTSLPKFGQAFGKQVYQDGNQKGNDINSNNSNVPSINSNSESSECQSNDNSVNLDHIGQINNPPLLLRKSPSQSAQTQPSQANLVQQLKQTIGPMNIQTMHGGVIYTRQIPVNIGGGQTINLITVPSTELIDDGNQKQKSDVKFVNQNDLDSPIIKIVPQHQSTTNAEGTQDDTNKHTGLPNENPQSTPTQHQPVLTQMRIKLPMLSKAPQMVSGARVVRPSFFQIQRNVIGGANQHVYQQLVLTAAPPLGQHTIRLPTAQANRQPAKTSTDGQSTSEPHMSSSTLEQLREFDMVLEQVKERSTVQPNSNSNGTFTKVQTPTTDTSDGTSVTSTVTESTQQVLYSIGSNQSLNVAYINRKTVATAPTTSTFVRSPDSSGVIESPSSSHSQIPHTVTSESTLNEASAQPSQAKPAKHASKSKSKSKSSNPPQPMKIGIPPKPTLKPQEDEQTTQRILYILAEYKEQVENSPDKDKPAPRRRTNPPTNPGSSKRKKGSSSSRRSGGRDSSPVNGDDPCRTMGSEDSSGGTSQGDCSEGCRDSHSPQDDSPRKVVRKLTFENETASASQTKPHPQRNVIVADGQTITVARGTSGKPTTAVLMPANYILPVSMVKGGQQIAIVTNRGPKLLTVAGGEGTTNALLLQRLIGPAGLKPVLTRPGVRQLRLPTAALHNLQAFNLTTATPVQPPDSTAPPASTPAPPGLTETKHRNSPWIDRDSDVKPERDSSSEGSEPWNLHSSADHHDYTYQERVRTDNMNRTVLEAIPDRYSPDMEAQRIFDKMFDVDSKKSFLDTHDDSSRCAYDIDASDCDDKVYHQVVHKKDGSTQRHHRLTHVSAAALRHKYAILEHELRLQKSLSEECEDLGVDSPSASELFPEAELLFSSSPAHEAPHHSHTRKISLHTQPTILNQSGIPQPDIDDQIATDELLQREVHEDQQEELDVASLGLDDGIVTVNEDGHATITLDQEEFARSHPNTTFHREPTEEGEVQPFTIVGQKGRQITSTIFHASRAPATVLVTAPQTTVISQANADHSMQNHAKYINQIINQSSTVSHGNLNLSSVLVKDNRLTKFDSILTDSRELHLSNTASAIIHSTGNATQVIRRVCYEDDKRDTRFLIDEPETIIAGDDAKMVAEDSSRDATLESIAGDEDNSLPERHAELFWESNSASERSESRRPMDFSSDSEKCCKSPSYDETNSTDSSGVGTHMRLDSVIKDARGLERSCSAEGSSADDTHPPLRTYPAKRMYHALDGDMERSVSGKTRAGESSPYSSEVPRRASVRGVVKRGCLCCTGSPAPPRPKKSRQRKPTMDFTN